MPDQRAHAEIQRLLGRIGDSVAEFAPRVFDLGRAADAEAFRELLAGQRPPLTKCDRLTAQIRELIKTREVAERWSVGALDSAAEQFLNARGRDTWGAWVHYPWLGTIVRVLPAEEFAELRTNRNRYKITASEQARLSSTTLGIVGLSAGHAIAVCLALESVGARFRLADYDPIELSNLNRVAFGVAALGVNKAVATARRLYEIDPYLQVSVFPEGITPDNLGAFILGDGKLDLLVEECDELYMKVRIREEARAHGIAVVMETNDRGLLDVERFDLDRSRPVFHGLLEDTHSDALRGLDTEGKTPFMLRILGTDMSPRLAASLIEIDKTITGWPQLGSGNALGAAVVTDTARRILLGQFESSGRFHVDLEALVGGTAEPASPVSPDASAQPATVQTSSTPTSLPKAVDAIPTRAEVEWLVGRAAMAPSGANDQPWRFVWVRGRWLDCFLERSRSGSLLDFEHSASYLALGAAAENACIAASVLRRAVELSVFPEPKQPDLVFRLALGAPSDSVAASPLASCLETRATNRRLGQRVPLADAHAHALHASARERDGQLALVTDPGALSELGEVLGAVDRFRFSCARLHSAMMGELRWTTDEAVSTGDGIDVATLELDAVSMAGLRLLANPRTAEFLRSLGAGKALEKPAKRSIATAAAVGLVSVHGTDAQAYFRGGRVMQHVWLRATELGLALQPMAVAPYLFARLTRGSGVGFTSAEIATLGALHGQFERIFPASSGRADVMLFRLAHAPPPTARALRRPVGAILSEDRRWD